MAQASCALVCCWLVVVLGTTIPFMTIGFVFLHDCPLEPFIPIFLVVYGITALFLVAAEIVFLMCKVESAVPVMIFRVIGGLFTGAWMIAGCVWVFSTERPQANATEEKACDPTVYNAAFALVIIALISLCLSCLRSVCSCLCSSKT